jgi:hypothetical protein
MTTYRQVTQLQNFINNLRTIETNTLFVPPSAIPCRFKQSGRYRQAFCAAHRPLKCSIAKGGKGWKGHKMLDNGHLVAVA